MPDEKKPVQLINFDYVKSTHFRVVHADGAYLALTGDGGLTMSFFSERQPIPQRVVYRVNPDGTIGEEVLDSRVIRDAIVRETEFAITMTQQTALRVKKALDDMLKQLEELKRQVPGAAQ
jgi:hypothetical protein